MTEFLVYCLALVVGMVIVLKIAEYVIGKEG